MVAPKPMPASLRKSRQQFETWRKNRESPKSRIPASLWSVAVQASKEHGNHRAARALRVNPDYLKKQVAASARRSGKGKASSPAAFVEVMPGALSGGAEYSVELEDASGARMKILVKGDAPPDLASLTSIFWREDA